jgi:DNA primase catalytic subunit
MFVRNVARERDFGSWRTVKKVMLNARIAAVYSSFARFCLIEKKEKLRKAFSEN